MKAMKRAVYVLVARMDTELDDRDFGHWLRFLKQLSHVYRPKIFLVGTHRDKLEDGDKKRLPDNTWTCGWGDVSCVSLYDHHSDFVLFSGDSGASERDVWEMDGLSFESLLLRGCEKDGRQNNDTTEGRYC